MRRECSRRLAGMPAWRMRPLPRPLPPVRCGTGSPAFFGAHRGIVRDDLWMVNSRSLACILAVSRPTCLLLLCLDHAIVDSPDFRRRGFRLLSEVNKILAEIKTTEQCDQCQPR